jgi:hypothetical protein
MREGIKNVEVLNNNTSTLLEEGQKMIREKMNS